MVGYTKSEFAQRYGATYKNLRWSWVAINESDRVAYFLAWNSRAMRVERRYPLRTDTDYRQDLGDVGSSRPGAIEWQETVDRVLSGELEARLAVVTPVDEDAHPREIERVSTYAFTGRVDETEDGEFWFLIEERIN